MQKRRRRRVPRQKASRDGVDGGKEEFVVEIKVVGARHEEDVEMMWTSNDGDDDDGDAEIEMLVSSLDTPCRLWRGRVRKPRPAQQRKMTPKWLIL